MANKKKSKKSTTKIKQIVTKEEVYQKKMFGKLLLNLLKEQVYIQP